MTIPRIIEYVVDSSLFATPPVCGAYYFSPSGKTAVCVSRVRRMFGQRPKYRLFGMRIKIAELPTGIAPLPWPARPIRPPTRPGPAEAPRMAPAPSTAARAQARDRIRALLRDDRNEQRPVPVVRLDNRTVALGEWRDPEDLNAQRRSPKLIHGYRADDSVQTLLNSGTISKRHAQAARRFRKLYETGEVGLRPSRDLSMPPNGFASGSPPTEYRLQALQDYRFACAALGHHLLSVILAIVIAGHTIEDYAIKRRMNRSAASGYVLASLDLLSDLFKKIDDEKAPAA